MTAAARPRGARLHSRLDRVKHFTRSAVAWQSNRQCGERLGRVRTQAMTKRLVFICDWLPPDFGAVGQYAVLDARERASEGWVVTLVGLTSGPSCRRAAEPVGQGSLEIVRVHRRTYQKHKFVGRLSWTIRANVVLLAAAFKVMRRADAVLFTGSPPLLLPVGIPGTPSAFPSRSALLLSAFCCSRCEFTRL